MTDADETLRGDVSASRRSDPFPGKPQYLYRYCSAERALQIVRDNAMYLVPPFKMNDLTEGTPARLTRYSGWVARELEIRRFAKEGLARQNAAELVDESVSIEEQKENFEYFSRKLQKLAVAMRDHSGLICLSAAFNHQKMWGTYGDSHAGACIQFWRDEGRSLVHKHALPVEYTTDDLTRLLVDGLRDDGAATPALLGKLLFMKKTPEWSDEHEWRVIMLDSKPVPEEDRLFRFLESNIRRIFLGPRMSDETRSVFHRLAIERDLIWSAIDVRVDPVGGVSTFHGVELNRSLEDLEWHAALGLPS